MKYFDMGKNTATTSTTDASTQKLNDKALFEAIKKFEQLANKAQQQAEMKQWNEWFRSLVGENTANARRQQQINAGQYFGKLTDEEHRLAQEYAKWQQSQLAGLAQQPPPSLTFDEDFEKYLRRNHLAPYKDPPPAVANSPTCPQCNKILLKSEATWAQDRYYWVCTMHGLWRKLDGKVIPPHPDDSDNCGHWIKDGMLWIWERQRWECVGCRNEGGTNK